VGSKIVVKRFAQGEKSFKMTNAKTAGPAKGQAIGQIRAYCLQKARIRGRAQALFRTKGRKKKREGA